MIERAAIRHAVIEFDSALLRIEDALISLLLAACFCIMIANAFWRYVLNEPFLWSLEVLLIIFGYLVFFGASASLPHHQHMRVDALVRIMPGWLRAVVGVAAVTATLAIIAILLTTGITYCIAVYDDQTPQYGVSLSVWYGAMPASMATAIIHVVRLVIEEGPTDALKSSAESEAVPPSAAI